MRRLPVITVSLLLLLVCMPPPVLADSVTCLGRVEPLDGVIVLAGPSLAGGGAVIATLDVAEGDEVEAGQVLAVLDDYALRDAELRQQKELVADARLRLKRLQDLSSTQSTSRAKLDEARYRLRALEASQVVYEARRDMSLVRSPKRAHVLEIFTQPGEKVGARGIMELGETDRMSVVAEVYETDIQRVRVGQKAQISSPALAGSASGTVSRIALKVGKQDVLDVDPVAEIDSRVVETTILLDQPEQLRQFTNLQVDVEIQL